MSLISEIENKDFSVILVDKSEDFEIRLVNSKLSYKRNVILSREEFSNFEKLLKERYLLEKLVIEKELPVLDGKDFLEGISSRRAPAGFWKGEIGDKRAKNSLEWFCNEKKILSKKDCSNISLNDFIEKRLNGLLQEKYKNSPYLALKTIFLDLNPWDMKYKKNMFKNEDNERRALIDYFIELGIGDISSMSAEEIYRTSFKDKISTVIMRRKFPALLDKYNGSAYATLKTLFPDKIYPWFLKGKHLGWKPDRNAVYAKAVRWLFEKYLKIPTRKIPSYACSRFFKDMNLKGIGTVFNGSTYQIIDNAYPGVFSKNQFSYNRKIKPY